MHTNIPSTIDQSKGSFLRSSFLYNSVEVRLVPFHGLDVHPVTGIALYVSGEGPSAIGVRVYPDGHMELCNATYTTCDNCKDKFNANRENRYLQFKQPWAPREHILVSHAVYLAWCGPIKPGMTIDHIDGCTTNNDYRNLRQVSGAINSRDGGFLRKLKKVGINPQTLQRWMILRYFDRMAKFKESHTKTEYKNLSEQQLKHILYDNN